MYIDNALKLVHNSHKEASRTIGALRPQNRDAASILDSLKESAERLSDGGFLHITTTLRGKSVELPLEVTDAFFRAYWSISRCQASQASRPFHASVRLILK